MVPEAVQAEFDEWLEDYIDDWKDELREHLKSVDAAEPASYSRSIDAEPLTYAGHISAPESPGEGWVETTPGPRGGKRWVRGDERTGEKTPTAAEAGERQQKSAPAVPSGTPEQARESRIMHLSDLMTAARRGDDRTPVAASFANYVPLSGQKGIANVAAAVQRVSTDPYMPADLGKVYDAAKTADPSLTMPAFHAVLGRLHHEGNIHLRPATRAVSDIDRPEATFPMSGELMNYVSLERKL